MLAGAFCGVGPRSIQQSHNWVHRRGSWRYHCRRYPRASLFRVPRRAGGQRGCAEYPRARFDHLRHRSDLRRRSWSGWSDPPIYLHSVLSDLQFFGDTVAQTPTVYLAFLLVPATWWLSTAPRLVSPCRRSVRRLPRDCPSVLRSAGCAGLRLLRAARSLALEAANLRLPVWAPLRKTSRPVAASSRWPRSSSAVGDRSAPCLRYFYSPWSRRSKSVRRLWVYAYPINFWSWRHMS